MSWLIDTKESRIVRVNALQALYDLNKQQAAIGVNLPAIARLLVQQNIPSLTARIKKLGLLKEV